MQISQDNLGPKKVGGSQDLWSLVSSCFVWVAAVSCLVNQTDLKHRWT